MRPAALVTIGLAGVAVLFTPGSSEAATVSAGGLAIIGYNDNNEGPSGVESFAVLATEDIVAGTTIYFTNNAWSNADMAFLGAGGSSGQGDGFEQVMKLTVSGTISAGTVFTSVGSSGSYAWDVSSSIAGVSGSMFGNLELKYPGSFSDEIYIFQASTSNPLFTPTSFVYALNFGDASDPGFNDPLGQYDVGAIPNGNVSQNGGNTFSTTNALSDTGDENDPQAEDNTAVLLDPEGGFHNGWFGLNLSSGAGLALNTSGGTKEQWLRLINDSNNWVQRTDSLPSGPLNFTPAGAPEPSRSLLVLCGVMAATMRRRRA